MIIRELRVPTGGNILIKSKINSSLLKRRVKLEKTNKNHKYYEEHHILPKSIFPEFTDLKIHAWNSVLLTAREHFICHLLLWKHYKYIKSNNQYKMSNALNLVNKWGKYNSKLYEIYKVSLKKSEESKIKNGISHTGKKHPPRTEKFKNKMSLLMKEKTTFQKQYIIYDDKGKIIYEINSRFDTFCKENNLPFTSFRQSYLNNGEPIYTSNNKTRITKIKNSGYYHLKGWYAKYK